MKRPPAVRLIHLVRHGSSDYDAVIGLNERGREQARHLAAGLARLQSRLPISCVISSGVPRARETADVVASGLAAPKRRVLLSLGEGIPSRVPGLDLPDSVDEAYLAKTTDRLHRTCATLFRPVRRSRAEVVVSHGNWIRAMLSHALGLSEHAWHLRWNVPYNASVSTVIVFPDRLQIVRYNDTSHLPAELVTMK